MATINQLSSVDALADGDQLPLFSEAQGDTRKSSLHLLRTWLGGYFATQDDLEAIQVGGVLQSGAWAKLPAIYKFYLAGTGTATIDVRAQDGTVTSSVASYDINGFAEVFPYFEGAYEVRAWLTGTANVEVV